MPNASQSKFLDFSCLTKVIFSYINSIIPNPTPSPTPRPTPRPTPKPTPKSLSSARTISHVELLSSNLHATAFILMLKLLLLNVVIKASFPSNLKVIINRRSVKMLENKNFRQFISDFRWSTQIRENNFQKWISEKNWYRCRGTFHIYNNNWKIFEFLRKTSVRFFQGVTNNWAKIKQSQTAININLVSSFGVCKKYFFYEETQTRTETVFLILIDN